MCVALSSSPALDLATRAAIDSSRLRARERETVFDGARLTYESAGPEYHTVLMRAPGLLDAGGATRAPRLAALMLGDDPALHRQLFAGLQCWYGFVTPIPAGDDRGELERLISWPPFGHWLDHLCGDLVERCGGREHVSRSLPGHALTWDGHLTARLPVAAQRALDPELEPEREQVRRLIEGAGA